MEVGKEGTESKGPGGMSTAYQGTAERPGCWGRGVGSEVNRITRGKTVKSFLLELRDLGINFERSKESREGH